MFARCPGYGAGRLSDIDDRCESSANETCSPCGFRSSGSTNFDEFAMVFLPVEDMHVAFVIAKEQKRVLVERGETFAKIELNRMMTV